MYTKPVLIVKIIHPLYFILEGFNEVDSVKACSYLRHDSVPPCYHQLYISFLCILVRKFLSWEKPSDQYAISTHNDVEFNQAAALGQALRF